jgi:iron complex transport system permease protein
MSGRTATAPEVESPDQTERSHTGRAPRTFAVLSVLVLLVVLVLSLMVGTSLISPAAVWHGLIDRRWQAGLIVWDLRIPRTIAGALIGVALGLAGSLMQSVTRNPLADPGLLGVNAGAACAVVLGIAYLHVTSLNQYVWFALVGAGIATVVVYLLGSAGQGAASPIRLVLAGAAITAVLTGVISAVVLSNSIAFNGYRSWTVGSLEGVTGPVVWQVVPVLVVGILLALSLTSALNAVALGDQMASALGAHVFRIRALAVLATTLLCGASTALAGPITFVGLVVPHMIRAFTGPDNRWVLPLSGVAGAVLVVVSDVIGRVVMRPSELQVSVVTAVIGAPVFILIVRRRRLAQL